MARVLVLLVLLQGHYCWILPLNKGESAYSTKLSLLLIYDDCFLFLDFRTNQGINPIIASVSILHYLLGVVNSPFTKFPQITPI